MLSGRTKSRALCVVRPKFLVRHRLFHRGMNCSKWLVKKRHAGLRRDEISSKMADSQLVLDL